MAQLLPLLKGVLVPVLASVLVYYASRRFLDKATGAVSVTVGFLAGHFALVGWSGLPPGDASHWLFFLVPLLLMITLTTANLSRPLQFLIALAFLAGSLIFMLRAMIDFHWQSTLVAILWIGCLALTGCLLGAGLRFLACPDQGGRWIRWHLVWILSLTAISLGLTGSALLAQLTGAMAAALGPLALLPKDRLHAGSALTALAALAVTCFAILGYFYSKLPAYAAILLILIALAPLLLPKKVRSRPGFAGLWPRIVTTAVPGLILIVMLIQKATQEVTGGPW